MARPVAHPERTLFKSGPYMEHQATQNAYYAGHYGYSYTLGNLYTDAAIRSGVVSPGQYTGLPEPKSGVAGIYQRATVTSPRNQPFDMFGNPSKQRGDIVLGQVLMGGYQFPGQAFTPRRSKGGTYMPNQLSMWMQSLGLGGVSPNYLRARRRGEAQSEQGWKRTLTRAPERVGDEKGASSIYQGFERYSTQETRLGTKYGTDPNAGFKRLAGHAPNQHYMSELSRMYKKKNTNTGPARRYERKLL